VEHDRYGQKQVFEKMRRTFMQVLPERFWVRDNFSPWSSFNIEEVETRRSYLSIHLNRGKYFPFQYRIHVFVIRDEGLELLRKCIDELNKRDAVRRGIRNPEGISEPSRGRA